MADKSTPKRVGAFAISKDEEAGLEAPTNEGQVKHTPLGLTTEVEWSRSGNSFYAQPCADKFPKLPPGLYRFVSPPMQPWYLERTAEKFEFPFKVYAASTDVIRRVCKHWAVHGGSLGVLLNGLRGAGKSVTAKLITNELIEEMGLPVLVVRDPIPLDVVFDNVQQHMAVIFDEFEKTHNEAIHPNCQQQLLSTIDGMSRSEFNRLILFTTNSTAINENFKDRPSRIHYKFEFNRVADEIIEGLINDMLPESLQHFKDDIFFYLSTREICTIDIVRATIKEVIAFEESPLEFEDLLNIEKGMPPSFTIRIVDPKTNAELKVLSSFWKLKQHERAWVPLLTGNKRAIESFADNPQQVAQIAYNPWDGPITLKILEPCMDEEESGYFLANVCVPVTRTFWKDYDSFIDDYGYHNHAFWMDSPPDNWEPLPNPKKARNDDSGELAQTIYNRLNKCQRAGATVYGSGKPGVFKIKIETNRDRGPVTRPTVQTTWHGKD